MIVHRSMTRARPAYVINSRLPVYSVTYGNSIGDDVTGLFTRIAPTIVPVGKEIASNAIGVISGKIGTEVGSRASNLAVEAFDFAKGKLMSLARGRKPAKLQSTNQMPPKINTLAKQRLQLIAGSGLKRLRFRSTIL